MHPIDKNTIALNYLKSTLYGLGLDNDEVFTAMQKLNDTGMLSGVEIRNKTAFDETTGRPYVRVKIRADDTSRADYIRPGLTNPLTYAEKRDVIAGKYFEQLSKNTGYEFRSPRGTVEQGDIFVSHGKIVLPSMSTIDITVSMGRLDGNQEV